MDNKKRLENVKGILEEVEKIKEMENFATKGPSLIELLIAARLDVVMNKERWENAESNLTKLTEEAEMIGVERDDYRRLLEELVEPTNPVLQKYPKV